MAPPSAARASASDTGIEALAGEALDKRDIIRQMSSNGTEIARVFWEGLTKLVRQVDFDAAAGSIGRGLFAIVVSVCLLPCASVQAQTAPIPPATGDVEPIARSQKWFQDSKFGIFLHWGIYSELGGVGQPGVAEWIMENARIPAKQYERLADFFNPTAFDADRWVRSFRDAGAKYIVVTSKHHDGFAMFDSKVSRYNVVIATPFKHDPMKDLAEACRKYDIKLFFYYSQLDWHHPDYFPRGRTGHSTGRPSSGNWGRYIDYEHAQLTELLTQYGPIGGIWFDGWWDQEGTAYRDRWRLKETYDLIHRLQPSALIVNNHHVTPFPGENYQAFEQDLPGENKAGFNKASVATLPLETAETMNGSWGFNLTDTNFKTTRTLIQSLVGAAGRNANYLLNTGPMPNGRIQPENLATLSEIGAWLKALG